jgi:hypothetical protein
MKKLVILFVLAFAFNQSEVKAQSIVIPVGEDVTIIDINATDIVLENITSGEIFIFSTAAEFNAALPSLNQGIYILEYTLNGERQRIKFKIKMNK